MAFPPGPYSYQQVLEQARERLASLLKQGDADAMAIAIERRTLQLMELDLKDRSHPPPLDSSEWRRLKQTTALDQMMGTEASERRWRQRYNDYLDFTVNTLNSIPRQRRVIRGPEPDTVLIVRHNPKTLEIVAQIHRGLLEWARRNRSRPGFVEMTPEEGLRQMLGEQKQYMVALRLVQQLPGEVTRVGRPRGSSRRPTHEVVIETAIGLIPVIGNAMALYESTSGRTLFGHQLSPLERSIVGASVLLPVAGRMIKGGRSLYTARRMETLYGRDAREWSRALASGERLSGNAPGYSQLRQGAESVRLRRPLNRVTKARVEQTLRSGVTQASRVQARTSRAVQLAFLRLAARHPVLLGLDDLALARVMARGPTDAHMKGQLLEELLENRVAALLESHRGLTGMGHYPMRGPVEFIPGHLIRDHAGRQISDGMLVRRTRDHVEILSIFEAKAGQRGARELSMSSGGFSSLSGVERRELLAYARDIQRELLEKARISGDPRTLANVPTAEAIQAQVLLRERGGQVRRDMERLGASADDTLTNLYIGSLQTPVRISPTRTRVVGVVPRDVPARHIQQELRELNYNTEIWGIDITSSALDDVVGELKGLSK